jgi:biotin carboxyl carrier protein
MKLEAEINGKVFKVEVRKESGRVFAMVDGREYEFGISEPEPGIFLLKRGADIYEAFVLPSRGDGPAHVTLNGKEYPVILRDPKRLRGSSGGDTKTDGTVEIRTAMPGKVVKVLSAVGDTVSKGTGVIVVEAMKMQNEMRSPKPGVVKEIRVAEGATVNAGEVLVTIE